MLLFLYFPKTTKFLSSAMFKAGISKTPWHMDLKIICWGQHCGTVSKVITCDTGIPHRHCMIRVPTQLHGKVLGEATEDGPGVWCPGAKQEPGWGLLVSGFSLSQP